MNPGGKVAGQYAGDGMRKIVCTVALSLWAVGALAQTREKSVADLARQAQALGRARAARIYTNDDIAWLRTLPISVIGEVRDEREESRRAAGREDPEMYWRKRFAGARQRVAQAETEVARLGGLFDKESARAALLMDWSVLTCDSKNGVFAPGYAGAVHLNDVCGQLSAAKARLESAQQELAGLDDQLRRAGGYPGWGRD